MKNLVKKIQDDAHQNNLWEKDSKIVIGVSGGPDSVCLLDILAKIKEKSELELHIAHVNYGLRGKDSEKDEKFVQDLAENYQLGLSVLLPGNIKKNESNEDNLRDIRYSFFDKIRDELGYELIAVAHNQDDQVETFLLHLLRGAGLQGLSGMRHRNGRIIRPLLEVSRKDILEYLKYSGLRYRTDRTNKDDIFFRNKIRNKLVPYLEKNFNPNIKKIISNSTSNITEDLDLISELSEKCGEVLGGASASRILELHPSLQKRTILKAIEKEKGDLKNIESAHMEEILKIIKSKKSKNQKFSFQGLKLTRKGDKLNLAKINK